MCLSETIKLFNVGVIKMYEIFVRVYTCMDYKESSCILRDYILYYSICYVSSTENSFRVCAMMEQSAKGKWVLLVLHVIWMNKHGFHLFGMQNDIFTSIK